MKLKKLNSWITLIANIGVVGGLIFLGFEVQQNTTQLRTESSYSVNEALSMLNAAIYNDPVLADVLVRGEKDLSSLDETELSQFISVRPHQPGHSYPGTGKRWFDRNSLSIR